MYVARLPAYRSRQPCRRAERERCGGGAVAVRRPLCDVPCSDCRQRTHASLRTADYVCETMHTSTAAHQPATTQSLHHHYTNNLPAGSQLPHALFCGAAAVLRFVPRWRGPRSEAAAPQKFAHYGRRLPTDKLFV